MKDPAILEKVNERFATSNKLGVKGFPTVLLKSEGKYVVLTEWYSSLADLNKQLIEVEKKSGK